MTEIRSTTADSIEWIPIESVVRDPRNARTHSNEQIDQLRAAFREFGWVWPILIDETNKIVAGHARLAAALAEGATLAKVIRAAGLTPSQLRAFALADNQLPLGAGWDDAMLMEELRALESAGFDVGAIGFDSAELDRLLGRSSGDEPRDLSGALAESFGVPPFSVLNAREGWWQTRKSAWISLGIRSELGRGENITIQGETLSEPGLNHYRAKSGEASKAFKNQSEQLALSKRARKQPSGAPGGSAVPAADYRKRQRGSGKGKPVPGTEAKDG